MSEYPIQELEEQNAIERIKLDTKKSAIVKQSQIAEVRKSFSVKKQSSFKTILSLANMMVGSAILVLPLKLYSAGYGSSIIAVIIMAIFTCVTARIISFHLKSEEKDFVQSIERVLDPATFRVKSLGKPWLTSYLLSSQAILWLGGIVYFLVESNIIYSIIFQLTNSASLPSKDKIIFSQFSFQWTGFIVFVVCFLLFIQRDLKLVLKLSSKGIYCIGFYFIFITYLAIKSIVDGKVSFGFEGAGSQTMIFFTGCGFRSFLQSLGVFSLSFMIHNLLSPVIKANKFQKNNPRDLSISFVVGTSILIFAGVVGLLGVFWRKVGETHCGNANTVMDLFDSSDKVTLVLLVISEALLCVQLITVLPIIAFLARTQLFNMVYGQNGIPPNWAFYTFSAVFTIILYIFQIFNFKPMALIEIAGSVGGFIIAYLVPIALHVSSLSKFHKKEEQASPSGLESSVEEAFAAQVVANKDSEEPFLGRNKKESTLSNISAATMFVEEEKQSKLPLVAKYIFYAIVLFYGSALAVLQFVDVECPK